MTEADENFLKLSMNHSKTLGDIEKIIQLMTYYANKVLGSNRSTFSSNIENCSKGRFVRIF